MNVLDPRDILFIAVLKNEMHLSIQPMPVLSKDVPEII